MRFVKPSSKKLSIFLTVMAALAGDLPSFAVAATQTVVIENIKFNPDHLEIHPGDTVVWQNKDLVPHTVTDENKRFDSGGIQPGASWKKKFKSAATVSYKCLYHPGMKATVSILK